MAATWLDDIYRQADAYGQQAVQQAQQGLTVLENANPSASTDKMRGYGDQVAGIATKIQPYATTISGLGDSVAAAGNTVLGTAAQSAGIGSDLTNMNADSSSSLVKELLSLYAGYDPNRLVASAAQDVNASYATGEGQLERSMSRQGINPSSGRSATLRQQFNTALNTARAAAKTRARMSGLDAQASAFQNLIVNNARNYTNDGVSQAAQGTSILVNAGELQNKAAQIMSQSASLFGSAADIEDSAANIDTSYATSLANQNNTLARVYQSQQSAKTSQASTLANYDAATSHMIFTNFGMTDMDGNVIRPASVTKIY